MLIGTPQIGVDQHDSESCLGGGDAQIGSHGGLAGRWLRTGDQ
jgi:hypothetical protein